MEKYKEGAVKTEEVQSSRFNSRSDGIRTGKLKLEL
jgi:hypothetical protein